MRLFFIIFCVCLVGQADWKEFVTQRLHQDPTALALAQRLSAFRWDAVVSETMDQLIDHHNPSLGTFKQRYYFNFQNAPANENPVFLWICGEWTCSPEEIGRGAIVTHAKTFKAHIVTLEHRYYGKSQPFSDLSSDHLRFLTTEQALLDLVAFKKLVQEKMGLTGPWIVVGGSYPGSLAAYARSLFPNEFVGALASSGPVKAQDNFEEYDKHVADVAGPECAEQIRKSYRLAEQKLGTPEGAKELRTLFAAERVQDDTDLLYLIADTGAFAIQYGYKAQFCGDISKTDPLPGYASFAKLVYSIYGMSAEQLTLQGAESTDPNQYLSSIGLRSWLYQSCLEYGYFQNAYHDSTISVRSARINPEYHRKGCEKLFGLSSGPKIDETNDHYYQPLLASPTSHIFYTNGEEDPWSLLSITQGNGNAVNPNTDVFTIEKAAHCDDLGTPGSGDSQSLKTARSRFQQWVLNWLATNY